MRPAVVGTGSWGATAAALLAAQGPVLLLGRDPFKCSALGRERRHPSCEGLVLPGGVQVSSDPARLANADIIFWAVPVQHSAAEARRLAAALPAGVPLVSLSKGLEQKTLRRPSEILADLLGSRPMAALSGPGMAPELARGLPAALVVAGPETTCQQVTALLHADRLRLYRSGDLLGVELCGALKNVVAIAAGLCEGMGLGDNAKASLITRGLAEMRRLGRCLGAQDGTFAGLAGLGDLITTCSSPHGRNRRLGLALAKGGRTADLLAPGLPVAEGAWTCRAAVDLGHRHGVELPIASQVASVLWDATPVAAALANLLSRSPKEEDA